MASTKPHAGTGNKNAKKYRQRARIEFQCEKSDKERWIKAAKKRGLPIADCVSEAMNAWEKSL